MYKDRKAPSSQQTKWNTGMVLPEINQRNIKALKPRQHQQENWHIVNEAKTCFRTQTKRILKIRQQDIGQTQRPSQSGRTAGIKKTGSMGKWWQRSWHWEDRRKTMPATRNNTRTDLKEKKHKDVDSADSSDIFHQFQKGRKFLDQMSKKCLFKKEFTLLRLKN